MIRRWLFIVRLLLLSVSACAWSQPETLGAWRYAGHKDFEPTQAGAGVLFRYMLDGVRGDIFYYGVRREWQDGLSDPMFDQAIAQSLQEIKAVEIAGIYRDLQFLSVADVPIEGLTFKRVRMNMAQQGVRIHSLFYISAIKSLLQKFRMTGPQDSSEQLLSDSEQLIRAALDGRQAGELPWHRR